jgi:hypothetical protein
MKKTETALWFSRHTPTPEQLTDLQGMQLRITPQLTSLATQNLGDDDDVERTLAELLAIAANEDATRIYGVFAAPLQERIAATATHAIERGEGMPLAVACYAAWNIQRTEDGGKPTFKHKKWCYVGHLAAASLLRIESIAALNDAACTLNTSFAAVNPDVAAYVAARDAYAKANDIAAAYVAYAAADAAAAARARAAAAAAAKDRDAAAYTAAADADADADEARDIAAAAETEARAAAAAAAQISFLSAKEADAAAAAAADAYDAFVAARDRAKAAAATKRAAKAGDTGAEGRRD